MSWLTMLCMWGGRPHSRVWMVNTVAKMGALLLAVLPVAACTVVISGSVRPAPGLPPKPITGSQVREVLLDHKELGKRLDQGFEGTPSYSHYGSGDEALHSSSDVSPSDCAVSIGPMQTDSYPPSKVQEGAREVWWNDHSDDDAKVIAVEEGVVALDSAAEADALFAKITEQWKHCDGVEVTATGDTYSMSGVKVADSVLSANSKFGSIPEARAVGVRVNCLVEMEVTFYSSSYPGAGDRIASDLVREMMARITERS